MERPKGDIQPKRRRVTGEVLYLDAMRATGTFPESYSQLGRGVIRAYQARADALVGAGARIPILDDYERYDQIPGEVVASCIALTDELLKLKEPDSPLIFVDVVVESKPGDVLARLQSIAAGKLLAADDEQLAIPSDGDYYPILDMRKENAKLVGVRLTAWGWDDAKYVNTNEENEPYDRTKHLLVYPSDETSSMRRLELSFAYSDGHSEEQSGGFTESVSLTVHTRGNATISSHVWAPAYAETGYEGHKGESLSDFSDDDIAAFGDLIAEIVGDEPESLGMKIDRAIRELTEAAVTPSGRQAIEDLVATTWPAQARYLLTQKRDGAGKTIAEELSEVESSDEAVKAVKAIMSEWKKATA